MVGQSLSLCVMEVGVGVVIGLEQILGRPIMRDNCLEVFSPQPLLHWAARLAVSGTLSKREAVTQIQYGLFSWRIVLSTARYHYMYDSNTSGLGLAR